MGPQSQQTIEMRQKDERREGRRGVKPRPIALSFSGCLKADEAKK